MVSNICSTSRKGALKEELCLIYLYIPFFLSTFSIPNPKSGKMFQTPQVAPWHFYQLEVAPAIKSFFKREDKPLKVKYIFKTDYSIKAEFLT